MGSCVYQVGGYGGVIPGINAGGWMYELDALSGAWNEARDRAFARLALEAEQLRADAVIGVQITRGERELTEGAVECMVVGTAVRRGPRSARAGAPATAGGTLLTELSVPDYAKLRRAGIETLGVVAWTSIFYVQSWSAAALGGRHRAHAQPGDRRLHAGRLRGSRERDVARHGTGGSSGSERGRRHARRPQGPAGRTTAS